MNIWALKTDANGAMEWKTVIVSDPNTRGVEIIQTRNGGYVIAGSGTDIRHIGPVPFLFRLDGSGKILPDIHLSSTPDYGSSVAEAPDNGSIIVSFNGIIARVNGNGTVLWNITLDGESGWWRAISVPAGGYAVAGGNRVIRINEDGSIGWTTTLGKDRNCSEMIAVPDGGIVAGGTKGSDEWIARLSADGATVLDKTFSSNSPHEIYSVRITPAGTYEMIYGATVFSGDEKTGRWVSDTTMVSITDNGRLVEEKPVNVSRIITATTEGGYAYSGFAVPGFTELQPHGYSGSSLRLVRTDKGGNVTLNVKYDTGDYGPVSSMIQTSDGGFVIMGNSYNF